MISVLRSYEEYCENDYNLCYGETILIESKVKEFNDFVDSLYNKLYSKKAQSNSYDEIVNRYLRRRKLPHGSYSRIMVESFKLPEFTDFINK